MHSVTQSCPTLCDPMDCSLPGSCVHGISQARILEWAADSSSRDFPDPGYWIRVSCISCPADRLFTAAPPGKLPYDTWNAHSVWSPLISDQSLHSLSALGNIWSSSIAFCKIPVRSIWPECPSSLMFLFSQLNILSILLGCAGSLLLCVGSL